MGSQPQTPEFRINPENFPPCRLIKEATIIFQIQHFEADFLWKVSLKILNSGLILKTFPHADFLPYLSYLHIHQSYMPLLPA